MWSRVRRLSWPVRLYGVTVLFLAGAAAIAVWSVRNVEAAPCNPLVCVPAASLPAPQPTTRPNPFATATPSPGATPSPSASPLPGQAPGPGVAPVPGQDVGWAFSAQAAENGAAGLAKQLNSQLQAPNVSGDWFSPLYGRMTTIGIYVLLLCLLLAVIQFLMHRQFGIVAAAWFGWAPSTVGITTLGITVTNLALAITDGLSAYMLQGISGDVPGFLLHLATTLGLVAGGAGLLGGLPIVGFFLAIVIVVAIVGIIVELLVRQIVIYVCLLWLPLVASAAVWPPAKQWLYRLLTLQFTVIFAKFAVVTVLALGVAAFAAAPNAVGPLGDPNMVAIVMGLIVLVVAFISPWVWLKLLPHNFDHAASSVTSGLRRMAGGASRGIGGNVAQRLGFGGGARAVGGMFGSGGLPVASKTALAGAGGAVLPISLVLNKGGQVVAARGGKVVRQAQGVAQGGTQQQGQQPQQPQARQAGVRGRRPRRGQATPASTKSPQPTPTPTPQPQRPPAPPPKPTHPPGTLPPPPPRTP